MLLVQMKAAELFEGDFAAPTSSFIANTIESAVIVHDLNFICI